MDTPLPQHARSSARIWSRLSSKLRIAQAQMEPSKAHITPLLVLDNPELIAQLPLISQMGDNSGNKDRSVVKSRKRLPWPLLRSSLESSPPATPIITSEKKLNSGSFYKKLRGWKQARLHIRPPPRRASITTLYSNDLSNEDDTVSEGSSNLDTTLVDSPAEETSQFLSEICQMSLLKLQTAPRSMEQLLFIHMMLVKCNRHERSPDRLSAHKFDAKLSEAGQPADDEKWWQKEDSQNPKYSRTFYAPQDVGEVFVERPKDLLPKFLELPMMGLEDIWSEATRRVEEHLAFVNSIKDKEDSLSLEVVRHRSLCAMVSAIELIEPADEPIESAVEPDMGKRLESLQSELLSIFNF